MGVATRTRNRRSTRRARISPKTRVNAIEAVQGKDILLGAYYRCGIRRIDTIMSCSRSAGARGQAARAAKSLKARQSAQASSGTRTSVASVAKALAPRTLLDEPAL